MAGQPTNPGGTPGLAVLRQGAAAQSAGGGGEGSGGAAGGAAAGGDQGGRRAAGVGLGDHGGPHSAGVGDAGGVRLVAVDAVPQGAARLPARRLPEGADPRQRLCRPGGPVRSHAHEARGKKLRNWAEWLAAYKLGSDFLRSLKSFMEEPTCWTPAQFNSLSIPQLHAIFGDHDGQPHYMSAVEQLAWMNAERAKRGLPAIAPRARRNGRA